MRRLPPIAGLILAALLLTGCSDGAITDTRIQNSVGATFANLWDLQQSEQGHPHAPVGALQSQASCHRSDPAEVAVGAANDWVCSITWLVDGPGTPATALYTLSVTTNGCYTAEGDGPSSMNGSATLQTPSGSTANPLFRFNGCFDTT